MGNGKQKHVKVGFAYDSSQGKDISVARRKMLKLSFYNAKAQNVGSTLGFTTRKCTEILKPSDQKWWCP